jgi:hypothetical protein
MALINSTHARLMLHTDPSLAAAKNRLVKIMQHQTMQSLSIFHSALHTCPSKSKNVVQNVAERSGGVSRRNIFAGKYIRSVHGVSSKRTTRITDMHAAHI